MALFLRLAALVLCAAIAVAPAYAHSGSVTGGFAGGFAHPLFGPDHIVAMVAVGLWGALLGAPAIWLLPITFPLVMAFGGVLGIIGVPIPGVEIGIAASARARPHGRAGRAATFVDRGSAGRRIRDLSRPRPWRRIARGRRCRRISLGFVIATGMLHLCGIAFGLLARWPAGRIAVRTAGAAIALAGVAFLSGVA